MADHQQAQDQVETRTTPVDDATLESERQAPDHADAGRGPTPDEAAAADRSAAEQPAGVAEHYEEYLEMATEVQGEGRIP